MKKKLIFILSLLMAAALMASLSLSAFALEDEGGFVGGQEAMASGEQDRTLFIAGETVGSEARVKGIVLAAGNNVNVAGTGEYVMAAGRYVAVTGAVENDAFAAGYSVAVNGDVQRDAYAVGNDVTLNGSVGRSLYASAASVVINGRVGGDAKLNADTIYIGSDAVIDGTLSYNSRASISFADGSSVAGTEVYADTSAETPEAAEAPVPATLLPSAKLMLARLL